LPPEYSGMTRAKRRKAERNMVENHKGGVIPVLGQKLLDHGIGFVVIPKVGSNGNIEKVREKVNPTKFYKIPNPNKI